MLHPISTPAGVLLVGAGHVIAVGRDEQGHYQIALSEGREVVALPTPTTERTLARLTGGVEPATAFGPYVPAPPVESLPLLNRPVEQPVEDEQPAQKRRR